MRLLYFAWIRERLGMGEETIELPDGITTFAELMAWQRTRGEAFEAVFEHEGVVRVAADQEHIADLSVPLAGVTEIAFFPPMTGG